MDKINAPIRVKSIKYIALEDLKAMNKNLTYFVIQNNHEEWIFAILKNKIEP